MIEEINPERFNIRNYEPYYWTRLGLEFSCRTIDCVRKARDICIGYCSASRLSVRPREDEFAVLCEDKDGTFWFHVTERMLRGIISDEEYRSQENFKIEMITPRMFAMYEKVRKRGDLDMEKEAMCAITSSGLDSDEYWTIHYNYDMLKEKFDGHVA